MSFQRREVLSRVRSALPGIWTAFYGVIAGVGSFLVGYALTYLLEGRRVLSPGRPLVEFFVIGVDAGFELNVGPMGALPEPYQFAAWQYLTLHGADFERYLLTESSQDVWTLAPPETPLLVFVPAVLLLAAGGVVAHRCGVEDPWTAAKRGGTVTVGYLPLVVLLALGSHWAAPESVAIEHFGVGASGPQPIGTLGVSALPAALIAGLAFPIAFGSVGGYLAFLWSRRTWPTDAIARGGVAGAVTFLIGWGLTVGRSFVRAGRDEQWSAYLVQAGSGEDVSLTFDPGAFQVGTWQFHRLHGGDVAFRYVGTVTDGIDALRLPDLALEWSGFDLSWVLVAIPLVVVGAVLASRAPEQSFRGMATQGATVVFGYLPLSLVTALVVTETTTGSMQAIVGIALVDAFLLTGLAFPVAFGALGGSIVYLNAALKSVPRPPQTDSP